jgi:hypothetical protein
MTNIQVINPFIDYLLLLSEKYYIHQNKLYKKDTNDYEEDTNYFEEEMTKFHNKKV